MRLKLASLDKGNGADGNNGLNRPAPMQTNPGGEHENQQIHAGLCLPAALQLRDPGQGIVQYHQPSPAAISTAPASRRC